MILRRGDHGPDVGKLQQALLEAGKSISPVDLSNSTFGASTLSAVEDFQSHHVGVDGHVLAVDGVVGPATLGALANPGQGSYLVPGWRAGTATNSLAAKAVASAVADIGLHEDPDGSNDSPTLKKFRTYGRPWCVLAVATWWRSAGTDPFDGFAAASEVRAWGAQGGHEISSTETVAPGDVFVILRAPDANGEVHGHVGMIVAPGGTLTEESFFTVEGNCGNAVRGCRRFRSAVTAVVRPFR